MNETLANLDNLVATLIEGLKRRLDNCFNIIIVSDHGAIIHSRCTWGVLHQRIVNFDDVSTFSYGQDK